jgi:hypothetical protein
MRRKWRICFNFLTNNWNNRVHPLRYKNTAILKKIWKINLMSKMKKSRFINQNSSKYKKLFLKSWFFAIPKWNISNAYHKHIWRRKRYFVYSNIFPYKTPVIKKILDVEVINNEVQFKRDIIVFRQRVAKSKYRIAFQNRFLSLINLTQKFIWFTLFEKKKVFFLFTNWFFFRDKLALFFCEKIKYFKSLTQYFILLEKHNSIFWYSSFIFARKQKINWKWTFGSRQRWRRRRQDRKFLANYSLTSTLKYYKEYNFRILRSTIFPSLFKDTISFSYDWSRRFHNSFTFFLYKGC